MADIFMCVHYDFLIVYCFPANKNALKFGTVSGASSGKFLLRITVIHLMNWLYYLLFGSKLDFSQILESLYGAFWRCSRVQLQIRRKWTSLDEIWSTLSTLSGANVGITQSQAHDTRYHGMQELNSCVTCRVCWWETLSSCLYCSVSPDTLQDV